MPAAAPAADGHRNFDPQAYRKRNTVERAINKLKLYRAVATRYDKLAVMYRAGIDVATIRIWPRHPLHDPRDTP